QTGDGSLVRWTSLFARVALASVLVSTAAESATPSISGGSAHSIALNADGTVRSWGTDFYGELGIGSQLFSSSARQVPGVSGVRAVAAGFGSVLAARGNGTASTWGIGYLGNGSLPQLSTPSRPIDLPELQG